MENSEYDEDARARKKPEPNERIIFAALFFFFESVDLCRSDEERDYNNDGKIKIK